MPFAPFEWMLALRYLRARRKESFISVITGFSLVGITLGVATLIIVMSVMNGFRTELMGKILGVNGHMQISSYDGTGFKEYESIAEKIREIPGVVKVTPYLEGQVMASANDANQGVLIRGIRERDFDRLRDVGLEVLAGDLKGFDDVGGLVLGSILAQQLGAYQYSSVTLVSPKGSVTPFGVTPRIKAYPVTAVATVGMSEYDKAFAFMRLADAQIYFNLPDAVNTFEIMVEDPDQALSMVEDIEEVFDGPVAVRAWQVSNQAFFEALQVERNVMFLILSLIILVAALNIVSGLIMLVKDKGQDIAILRSMGASRGAIMRIFCMTGSSIGIVGTFLGFLVGVLFCQNIEAIRQGLSALFGVQLFNPLIYFLSEMPVDMQNDEVFAVVLMALGISFLATLYPSWRAARLDPVQALRYE